MNDFIPCAGSITIIFLFLVFIYAMRYLSYKETMHLAEKGLVKPVRSNGKGTLIWGILITAVGLALIIGLWPLGMMIKTDVPLGFGPWMLTGLLPTFFGLALVLIYVLTRESKDEGKDPPALPDEEKKSE